ncbi:unnamed protein product [Soboliphyme baturini]|uniref:SH3 domain-containing protein n=1 Tax=Soboliphyme baturini TaxID=241478 RepID=A0A183ICE9_9BILA|nr:unnamed protein product [Soboliphyme baturini]
MSRLQLVGDIQNSLEKFAAECDTETYLEVVLAGDGKWKWLSGEVEWLAAFCVNQPEALLTYGHQSFA